jgi:hypothetical protein
MSRFRAAIQLVSARQDICAWVRFEYAYAYDAGGSEDALAGNGQLLLGQ